MENSYLEALPSDLCLMILLELHSPRDVFATIQASRPYNEIFKLYKSSILFSSLNHVVPQDIFSDMTIACQAGEVSRLSTPTGGFSATPSDQKKHKFIRAAQMKKFLDRNLLDAGESTFLKPAELPLVSMCRLWSIVDYFVKDYAQFALQKLAGLTGKDASSPIEDVSTISFTEYGRLQRAFIRFETYRRVFGNSYRGDDDNPTADRTTYSHNKFLSTFFPWEEEELRSIREYLSIKIEKEMIDELEDHLVDRVRQASEKDSAPSHEYTESLAFDLIGLATFDTKYNQESQIEHMINLGLPLLRTLLEMPLRERLSVVDLFAWKRGDRSLLNFLATNLRDRSQPDAAEFEELFTDSVDNANSGWLWHFKTTGRCSSYFSPIRDAGYVFWDKPRLEKYGFFNYRLPLSYHTHFENNIRNVRDSVSKRTAGMKITYNEFFKLRPGALIEKKDMKNWLQSMEY